MPIFNYTNFSGLLNMGVSDFQKPADELSACKNIQEDRVGILKRVPGYSKASESSLSTGVNINFLHHYFQNSANSWAGQSYLVAWFGSWTGYTFRKKTTWEFDWYTGWTISNRFDLEPSAISYLDKIFMVGYDPVDKEYIAPITISGTTFNTSDSDTTDMPRGRYIVRYRDLPYVLYAKIGSDVYPSRAYFPDPPVNMALPVGSWNDPYHFEEFWQDDGDQITWGASAYDRLVVFKTHSMWVHDQETTKKIADIGCDSHKSIKVVWGILYWANRDGIWRWAGDLPQLISGKIQPFFDATNQSNLSKMVASNQWFEYRLFVGDVTIDWNEYKNAWICFDVRREKFYIRSTGHKGLSCENYIEDDKYRMYFGSDNGNVYKQSKYIDGINMDDDKEIDYFFITNHLDLWAPEVNKIAPEIYFFTHNCSWMKYVFDVNRKMEFNQSFWQISESNMWTAEIGPTANRFAIKFYWKDKDKPFEFEWFVIEVDWIENVQTRS